MALPLIPLAVGAGFLVGGAFVKPVREHIYKPVLRAAEQVPGLGALVRGGESLYQKTLGEGAKDAQNLALLKTKFLNKIIKLAMSLVKGLNQASEKTGAQIQKTNAQAQKSSSIVSPSPTKASASLNEKSRDIAKKEVKKLGLTNEKTLDMQSAFLSQKEKGAKAAMEHLATPAKDMDKLIGR